MIKTKLDYILSPPAATNNDEEDNAPTYLQSLIAAIFKNIRVKLSNIYIRFENTLSLNDERYAIGLRLKEFGIYSTNCNYEPFEGGYRPDDISQEEPKNAKPQWNLLKYKQIVLEGLCLFVDFKFKEDQKVRELVGSVDVDKLHMEAIDVYGDPKKENKGAETEFKRVLTHEFYEDAKSGWRMVEHNYLMDNFKVTVNCLMNFSEKDLSKPATVNYPYLQAAVIFGDDVDKHIKKNLENDGGLKFTFYQRQMQRIMKTLDTISEFDKMTDGAMVNQKDKEMEVINAEKLNKYVFE